MTTPHQKQVLDELVALGEKHPTVRSLTDRLETRYHRAERWSDDEVRGVLERLEADGVVAQYRDELERVRYCVAGEVPHE
jgi:Fe2+ or Zn2+ uptake regulation protein